MVRRLAAGLCVMAITLLLSVAGAAGQVKGKAAKRARPAAPRTVTRVEEVREAEQRLADLGYWTGPVDGIRDPGLYHALVAFQKIEGRTRTGKLTHEELAAIRTASRPLAAMSGPPHVEVDLARQVLFIVDAAGGVAKILPVSTGNGKMFTSEGWSREARTPCGTFKVQRKIAGWRKSPLGLLYYPNYIIGAVAIHGNPAVPVVPASHGCIRIPMFAAKDFSEMTPVGMTVLVHDGQMSGTRMHARDASGSRRNDARSFVLTGPFRKAHRGGGRENFHKAAQIGPARAPQH